HDLDPRSLHFRHVNQTSSACICPRSHDQPLRPPCSCSASSCCKRVLNATESSESRSSEILFITARGTPSGFSGGGKGRGCRRLLIEAIVFCLLDALPAHAITAPPLQRQSHTAHSRIWCKDFHRVEDLMRSKPVARLSGFLASPFSSHSTCASDGSLSAFCPLAACGFCVLPASSRRAPSNRMIYGALAGHLPAHGAIERIAHR